MASSQPVDSGCSLQNSFEYVVHKRWVAIALLVTSLACVGLVILGGLGQFSSHAPFMGQTGSLAVLITGSVVALPGLPIAITLLINKGRIALHRAIEKREELTDELLQQSKLNQPDHYGNTPLHYAVIHSYGIDTIKEKLPDATAKNKNGESPLDLAVKLGNVAIVTKLLGNFKTCIEPSIAEYSIQYASKEITMLLLQSGQLQGSFEPLKMAIIVGNSEYIMTLLQRYRYTDDQLNLLLNGLARNFHVGDIHVHYKLIIEHILKIKPQLINYSRQERTILQQACLSNKVELINHLLTLDAVDVNAKCYTHTALDEAALDGYYSIAEILVNSGKVSNESLDKAHDYIKDRRGDGAARVMSAILAVKKARTSTIS